MSVELLRKGTCRVRKVLWKALLMRDKGEVFGKLWVLGLGLSWVA